MKENIASAEVIVAYLTEILPRRQIYFGIYELKYAGKSGRIPTAAAKCRDEKKLIAKAVQMSVADMEPGTPYKVIYGCDPACRDEVKKAMIEC